MAGAVSRRGIAAYRLIAGVFKQAYSATARVKLAEKAFEVRRIEQFNLDVIDKELFALSLFTDKPLNEALQVPKQPSAEEDEALPEQEVTLPKVFTPSKIDVSIHAILPLPQHKRMTLEIKKYRSGQKSEIVIASP